MENKILVWLNSSTNSNSQNPIVLQNYQLKTKKLLNEKFLTPPFLTVAGDGDQPHGATTTIVERFKKSKTVS